MDREQIREWIRRYDENSRSTVREVSPAAMGVAQLALLDEMIAGLRGAVVCNECGCEIPHHAGHCSRYPGRVIIDSLSGLQQQLMEQLIAERGPRRPT